MNLLTFLNNPPERKITRSEKHLSMNQLLIKNYNRMSPQISLIGKKKNTAIAIYRKKKISLLKPVKKARAKAKVRRASNVSWR